MLAQSSVEDLKARTISITVTPRAPPVAAAKNTSVATQMVVATPSYALVCLALYGAFEARERDPKWNRQSPVRSRLGRSPEEHEFRAVV